MTNAGNRRTIELAACLAVMLHLALFLAVRPAPGNALAGALVPPNTHYMAQMPGDPSVEGIDARVLWSPLLFSLPSEMGFSHGLLHKKLPAPPPSSRRAELADFLEVDAASRSTAAQVDPQELMLTAGDTPAPRLPADERQAAMKRPAARRVYVAPALMERLEGGIVLPPALNKEADAAWEVSADISVSTQGTVNHVFLEEPLESTELNGQVLRLLYGLHFKSGETPVDGHIEIYSPETISDREVEP